MIKVLFVIPTVRKIGGIQSSLMNLLKNLDGDIYDIYLCVLSNNIDNTMVLPSYIKIVKSPIPFELAKTNFDKFFTGYNMPKLVGFYLVKIIVKLFGLNRFIRIMSHTSFLRDEYDIAISFANDIPQEKYIEGSNDFVINCVKAKKKIAWIHNQPNKLGFKKNYCKKVYSAFDVIVNVSNACKDLFDEIIPEFKSKSKVVYNIMDLRRIQKMADCKSLYNNDEFNLVTVSRIDNKQKRIDRVIECCQLLRENGFKFKWYVVGDGPDLLLLQKMAEEKKVDDVICFVGRKSNPYSYIKNADILVMTSDYEAHSMVLLESLAVGTPILCTSYPSAEEIVKSGCNGILMENNTQDIYNTVKQLINHPELIKKWRKYISENKISNELSLKQFYEVTGVKLV